MENDFLYEGMLEHLDTCDIYSEKPFILKDKHMTDRLFKDRNFIDLFELSNLKTTNVENRLMQSFKKNMKDIMDKWDTLNAKELELVNKGVFREFKTVKFLVRHRYNFVSTNPKTGNDFKFIIECGLQGSYVPVFSTQNKEEVRQIFKDNKRDAIEKVNALYREQCPTFANYMDNESMGFSKPYVTLHTAVIAFISPNYYPRIFAKHKDDDNWIFFEENCNKVEYRVDFNNYLKAKKKAQSLKAMKGLVALRENKMLSDLLNIGDDYDKLW